MALWFSQVSADITKKKINALSMELIEAKNKLDAKDKVSAVILYMEKRLCSFKLLSVVLDLWTGTELSSDQLRGESKGLGNRPEDRQSSFESSSGKQHRSW